MNYLDEEEREIRMREMQRIFDENEAAAEADRQRKVPGIGYGMLYDEDWEDVVKLYRMEVDILLPGMFTAWFDRPDRTKHPYDDIDDSSLHQLEIMVEHAVKSWLMDFAPKGTKTDLVGVDLTD